MTVTSGQHNDLVIIGGGSAAFAAALKASELGASVTMINEGLPIGGTCVNVGCVPSKTLIRAAEAHYRALHNPFSGIESGSRIADFRAIVEQKRQLVEEMRRKKYINIIEGMPNVTLIEGKARLVEKNKIAVNGKDVGGDHIIIATGAAPFAAPIPGLSEAGYLTNETAFELEELPESLIVLGGRYVALECAQMFSRFGSRVTILQRSERILPTEGEDITDALSKYLRKEGIEVFTNVKTERVRREGDRVLVETTVDGNPREFAAREILVATGRRPNTEDLNLEAVCVELDSRGFVKVDNTLRTSASSIYGGGERHRRAHVRIHSRLRRVPRSGKRYHRLFQSKRLFRPSLGHFYRSPGRWGGLG
ncbi:MAG: FAD-dependent oxidoreductase [Deltaproteobacteria bacterium]|nr:FAD-dependent oxidoreductase [Deltaproteobacteria bacterium]